MLNRLNIFRFPLQKKTGFVFCNITFQIEVNAVSAFCHCKEKWIDKYFAWIFENKVANSDSLISNTFWRSNGSEFLFKDFFW